MSLVSFFLLVQVILLVLMTFHDWVHIPPLTNIRELEKHSTVIGRGVNSALFFLLIFIPLCLTWYYQPLFPRWVVISLARFYGWLTVGTLISWWIPYLFEAYSDSYKSNFAAYRATHHFLPSRGDNIVPNTFHVILHLCIWSCFAISLYLRITG